MCTAIRCPVNHDLDIFDPGDMNAMFERWLEEAGQDTSSFSSGNPPKGGKHPFGEINVIASPYHDKMQYFEGEERDDIDTEAFSPVPWVVSIDGFLSGVLFVLN